ncbi:Hint domain-containing protein [Pseudotabrizicola algicola]|uniref:Hint domain-containing protein n=1 Tax=Pseudotabrizicola algicola TaxID=2709381 RepID=A0A6B3RHS6_9RHOB|nr:Hint domain-containing protein [Pseudotabrizicola algicola]NEX45584.1 Hint domain-containing protein [Pseudotabrizicola algicola]
MPAVELFLRGDQIATYASLSSSGNGDNMTVTMTGVTPLGGAHVTYRVVVRQVGNGQSGFQNGQFVDIYAWPDDDPPDPPIFRSLNPQHDQFQGRAASNRHQIFTSPARVLFQLDPIQPGTLRLGPGAHPPRNTRLPFSGFPSTPPAIPCFVQGTLIRTNLGEIPVERIRPGVMVQTMDNGFKPVIWAGQRKVCGLGSLAPVRFEAGTAGNHRRLLVSPQHRMLMSGWRSELATGERETFAAAVHLVNGGRVRRVRRPMVTYVHLLCEAHQVIFADGAPTESLFPGGSALSAFDRPARDEIRRLFPQLCPREGAGGGLARPVLNRVAARVALA